MSSIYFKKALSFICITKTPFPFLAWFLQGKEVGMVIAGREIE